ncbi:hypothetical protein HK405_010598, partial [Cladochytrium tenue]
IGAVALLLWLNTLHSGGLVVSGLARGLGFAVLPVGAGLLSLYVDKRFVWPAASSVAGLLLTAVGVDSFLRCGYAFGMVASITAGEIGEAMLKDYELTTAPLVLATLAAGFALASLIYIILRGKIPPPPPPPPPPKPTRGDADVAGVIAGCKRRKYSSKLARAPRPDAATAINAGGGNVALGVRRLRQLCRRGAPRLGTHGAVGRSVVRRSCSRTVRLRSSSVRATRLQLQLYGLHR